MALPWIEEAVAAKRAADDARATYVRVWRAHWGPEGLVQSYSVTLAWDRYVRAFVGMQDVLYKHGLPLMGLKSPNVREVEGLS